MANELYKMYKEMADGYKTNNELMLEHGAKCYMDMSPENPFDESSPEYDVFCSIRNYHSVWKLGGADYRVNRKRMLKAVKEMIELHPEIPYVFDKKAEAAEKREKLRLEKERLEEMQRKEAQKTEEAKIEEVKPVEIEEPEVEEKHYVFGVVPEEKKGFFKGLFSRRKKEDESSDSP